MSVQAFKKTVEVLSRFSDIRAPNQDPRSKIGVQVDKSGALTLISSSGKGGALVRVEGISVKVTSEPPFIYCIDSKPVMQAAKVLKGKGFVQIDVSSEGISFKTDGGGSVNLKPSSSIKDAGFAPKPKNTNVTCTIEEAQWEQISKILSAVEPSAIEPATIDAFDGRANIVSVSMGMRPMYASLMVPADGDGSASSFMEFWESLKVISGPGLLSFGKDGIIASGGNVECWGIPFLVSDSHGKSCYPEPWPLLSMSGNPKSHAIVNKSLLIDSIKGIIPSQDIDEYGRITIQISDGFINLSAFGDESGISVPAKTFGSVTRSLRGEYIQKMLKASFGKEVVIGAFNAPPISISSPEMPSWTILVAPVAFG